MKQFFRSLLIIVLIYLMLANPIQAPTIGEKVLCEDWRNETKYFMWMDGCQVLMEDIFLEAGQSVHPFAISGLCHDYFEKRFSVK